MPAQDTHSCQVERMRKVRNYLAAAAAASATCAAAVTAIGVSVTARFPAALICQWL